MKEFERLTGREGKTVGNERLVFCPHCRDATSEKPAVSLENMRAGNGVVVFFRCGCKRTIVFPALGIDPGKADLYYDPDGKGLPVREPDMPIVIDQFCRRVLEESTLSPAHREALHAAGWADDAIDAVGYKTWDWRGAATRALDRTKAEHPPAVIRRVPGVKEIRQVGGGSMAVLTHYPDGMLIPSRLDGRIVGLRLRKDKPDALGKYLYLSGGNPEGTNKVSVTPHVPLAVASGDLSEVRIVEGEKKADYACARAGEVPTISFPGVDQWPVVLPWLAGRKVKKVRIAFDADAGQKSAVGRQLYCCVKGLVEAGYDVAVEVWEACEGKGLDDLLAGGGVPTVIDGADAVAHALAVAKKAGNTEADLTSAKNARVDVARDVTPSRGAKAPVCHKLVTRPLSAYKIQPTEYLVLDLIPAGALTLLVADGGMGKSTILSSLVADLSRGRPAWGLEYAHNPEPVHTLLIQAEEHIESAYKPRIIAAGGNPDLIEIMEGTDAGDGGTAGFDLSKVEALRDYLRERPLIRLVVIDPIASFLGRGIDEHKDAELRLALAPLDAVAKEFGVSIILVKHVNKSTGQSVSHRSLGSVAYRNLARQSLILARDPDDDDCRLLIAEKIRRGRGVRLRSVPLTRAEAIRALGDAADDLPDDKREALYGQLSRIEGGGWIEADPEEAMAIRPGRRNPSEKDAGGKWLREFLSDGPRTGEECVTEGNSTLDKVRALKWWRDTILKEKLGGRCQKGGFHTARWYWLLPSHPWPFPGLLDDEESHE